MSFSVSQISFRIDRRLRLWIFETRVPQFNKSFYSERKKISHFATKTKIVQRNSHPQFDPHRNSVERADPRPPNFFLSTNRIIPREERSIHPLYRQDPRLFRFVYLSRGEGQPVRPLSPVQPRFKKTSSHYQG